MARDTKKYVYLTIGILRNGDTHRALLSDAQEHNTKQLPTVAGMRLSEYYQLKQSGLLYVPVSTLKGQQQISSNLVGDIAANVDAAAEAWPE